jgi:FAD/FMN-containing dehydrogenase
LIDIVGEAGVLVGKDVSSRSTSPFGDLPSQARVLVRPSDTGELSAIVKWCAHHRQRVVLHGGRTGVSGGVVSDPSDLIVSLERMRRIEEIDPYAQTATVQAGATLAALQEAAAPHGLMYPIDLLSQGTATIGGTLATNAGGNRVIRWGMTRQQVLGVEVVLADGTVLSAMNRLLKNNTGCDLKQLFIGSEGTLGIVSRAIVQLVPVPRTSAVVLAAVRDFDQLLRLLARARRLPILSAFEVMWNDYYALVARSGTGRDPLPAHFPYYVLVETLGHDPEYDEALSVRFHEDIFASDLAVDAVIAHSERDRQRLWRVREGAEVIVASLRPFVSFDIGLPLRRIESGVEAIGAALREAFPEARWVSFGHLGDGNIHLAVTVGPDTLLREHEVEAVVFRQVASFEGTISAEHGIGRSKRAFLHYSRSNEEIALMRRIKESLDPVGLLNAEVLLP